MSATAVSKKTASKKKATAAVSKKAATAVSKKGVLLEKKPVLGGLLEFLAGLVDTSTLTVNVRVADIARLTKGVRAETIHGLKNNDGPCIEIETQGSAQFFRPRSEATISDIDATVKSWAKDKGWHTKTVVALHNLQGSPFYADEEKMNFVVFFALSPRPIIVDSETGCALPGKYGNTFDVYGEWKNMGDKPPQKTVYSTIKKPVLSGTLLQRIQGKIGHAIKMLNFGDKPFLQYKRT